MFEFFDMFLHDAQTFVLTMFVLAIFVCLGFLFRNGEFW